MRLSEPHDRLVQESDQPGKAGSAQASTSLGIFANVSTDIRFRERDKFGANVGLEVKLLQDGEG
jgi:hypothetical protein